MEGLFRTNNIFKQSSKFPKNPFNFSKNPPNFSKKSSRILQKSNSPFPSMSAAGLLGPNLVPYSTLTFSLLTFILARISVLQSPVCSLQAWSIEHQFPAYNFPQKNNLLSGKTLCMSIKLVDNFLFNLLFVQSILVNLPLFNGLLFTGHGAAIQTL